MSSLRRQGSLVQHIKTVDVDREIPVCAGMTGNYMADCPPAYWRMRCAVEILAIGNGKDAKKLEDAYMYIFPLTRSCFKTTEEWELKNKIIDVYAIYSHPSRNKIDYNKPFKLLSSAHWTVRKKLKVYIFELFLKVIENK